MCCTIRTPAPRGDGRCGTTACSALGPPVEVATTTTERTGRSYKRHPTIGDSVTIYAGANILGGNTVIGSGSVIGGNAWIVESVPPNSRIFGREREPQPSSREPAEDGVAPLADSRPPYERQVS